MINYSPVSRDRASGKFSLRTFAIALALLVGVSCTCVGEILERQLQWDRQPTGDTLAKLQLLGKPFVVAEQNSRQASEGLFRCQQYVNGWLAMADPKSGLIPENEGAGRDRWNGHNNGADNYAFLVLTCNLTDRQRFDGQMRDMLRAETNLTCRLDRLGDAYLFSKQRFEFDEVDLDRLMFNNAEYVKDGLIPLTEWLGPSPWSDRMSGIVDDIWKNAPVETPFGKIPTLNIEVNGDLLQANSRLFWFTGERKYLDWAIRLGDYYLLGKNHPVRNMSMLSLEDHGGEIINGLTELYVTVSQIDPAKKKAYEKPLHEIFDSILAKGRNPDGMLYASYNPKTGENSGTLCDTWGYIYDGFLTISIVDGDPRYRSAVTNALSNLEAKYEGRPWADQTADGIADSVESALNLINRIPVATAAGWCDRQMRLMWDVQRPDGVIEGWHGDGNFARTTIMYVLWKSLGIRVEPWHPDVRLGAAIDGDSACIFLTADKLWEGKLVFDCPRHADYLHLPLDYPRINQFPEWFTARSDEGYRIKDVTSGRETVRPGSELITGIPLTIKPGEVFLLRVSLDSNPSTE